MKKLTKTLIWSTLGFNLLISAGAQASCEKLLKEARKKGSQTFIKAFDGLGTAEMGMGVLKKRVVSKIAQRCGANRIASEDFYYSKNGAKKAVQCALSFYEEFGNGLSLHVLGHSFGAGKGVFNFIEAAKKTPLIIENAITSTSRLFL